MSSAYHPPLCAIQCTPIIINGLPYIQYNAHQLSIASPISNTMLTNYQWPPLSPIQCYPLINGFPYFMSKAENDLNHVKDL